MQIWARADELPEETLTRAQQVISKELDSGCALSIRELSVSGSDLMRDAGIDKGPDLGRVLDALLAHVLENPEDNRRDELLDLARSMA
jgi:tRNA nucleotidyltransferase (CCA-adding enzyme)